VEDVRHLIATAKAVGVDLQRLSTLMKSQPALAAADLEALFCEDAVSSPLSSFSAHVRWEEGSF
jgi:hypothetical protein